MTSKIKQTNVASTKPRPMHPFTTLISTYNPNLTNKLWSEIITNYSDEGRFYHNLTHLENLLAELKHVKTEIEDWNTILFTLYYHDVIYDVSKNDNEEKSADFAEERMTSLGVRAEMISKCKKQILATKNHGQSPDNDTNFFTDADLSILGKDWNTYQVYFQNVRKEYAIYPDAVYKPGRKKILEHFLNMSRIFKTDYFFQQY